MSRYIAIAKLAMNRLHDDFALDALISITEIVCAKADENKKDYLNAIENTRGAAVVVHEEA